MSALVSLIMSVFNEEPEWLEESIDSILNQSYTNIELIVVLDNPVNDQLKNILIRRANSDKRVQLILNSENMGLVKSLNKALNYCRGMYIARMDADDVSRSRRIELQLDWLINNQLDFVFSGVKLIDENGIHLYDTSKRELNWIQAKYLLGITNISNHPTWFVKAEVYRKLNGYRDIPYCEDYEFSLRCLASGYKIGKMDGNMVDYRVRGNGISQKKQYEQFVISKKVNGLYLEGKLSNTKLVMKEMNEIRIKISQEERELYNGASKLWNSAIQRIRKGMIISGGFKLIKSLYQSKYYRLRFIDLLKYKLVLQYVSVRYK